MRNHLMRLTIQELIDRQFCGAKTRAGTPCKQRRLYRNGRCKLHGGKSTGPVTEEGKKKVSLNGFKKKQSP